MKNKLIVFLLAAIACTMLAVSASAACEHNWVETETTPAACEVEGSVEYVCGLCEATKSEPIAALAHKWGKNPSSTTAATCTEKGEKIYTCSVCKGTKSEEIDALGHTYKVKSSSSTAATCTEAGTQVSECTRCSATKTEDVAALDHNYKLISSSATCTASGTSTYQCTRCDVYDIKTDSKLGHDLEKSGGPTCTTRGKYVYECSRCDYTKTDSSYTKALGHDIPATGSSSWKTTKSATCEEEGTRRAKCSRCKEYVYEDIEKTDHDYDSDYYIIKVPTSSSTGKYRMTCEECGETTTKTITKGVTNLSRYTVPPVTVSVKDSIVEKGTMVELDCDLSGATIYYTLDGKSPTSKASRIEYDGDIEITSSVTLKAYAVYEPDDDVDASAIVTKTYIVKSTDTNDNTSTEDEEVIIEMLIDNKVAYINDEERVLDAVPVIKNDRTMLPIRFVAEALGAAIGWNDATRTVSIVSKDAVIKITVGANTATVDGKEVKLDSPSYIDPSNNRTYLPVRFVAEALGATVDWDDATKTITLLK